MSNNKDFKVKNGIKPTAYHEAVGTVVSGSVGYGFSSFTQTGNTLNVGSEYGVPTNLTISHDGYTLYTNAGNETIYQYDLTTPFDLSTASYSSKSYSYLSETDNNNDLSLRFSSDGTKMYLCGTYQVSPFPNAIWQYDLSTAWDVSTVTYDTISNNLPASDHAFFKPDGTKFYAVDGSVVRQMSLSTAWDVTTDSNDNKSLDVSSQVSTDAITELHLTSDGYTLYVFSRVDTADGVTNVYKYNMSTAWDVSTATYSNTSYTFDPYNATETQCRDVSLSVDGKYLYAVGYDTDVVTESSFILTTASLDLSTGSVFEITPTSDVTVSLSNPAASGTVSGATLLLSASGTAYTITYDTAIQWAGGTAPTSPAIGETDVVTFSTRDGGTTYSAALAIDGAQ